MLLLRVSSAGGHRQSFGWCVFRCGEPRVFELHKHLRVVLACFCCCVLLTLWRCKSVASIEAISATSCCIYIYIGVQEHDFDIDFDNQVPVNRSSNKCIIHQLYEKSKVKLYEQFKIFLHFLICFHNQNGSPCLVITWHMADLYCA